MQGRTPDRESLEAIERASVDELRALELVRLQASLRHAYRNVAHNRRAFDADPEIARDEGGRLVALIKNRTGVSVAVEVVAPGGIERSAGKMRRIVDNRPTD